MNHHSQNIQNMLLQADKPQHMVRMYRI